MLSNKVAVVILNWNGKSFLEKFLPIVVKYSSNAQIIVADNQSTDNSVDFLKSHFPEISVIINPFNDGFAKGYNLALKQVNAQYYILLNSDVEVTENWIEPIIQLMESTPKIAACQPKILDYNHTSKFEYAGAAGGFIDKYGYPFCRGRIFNVLEEDKGQYDTAKEVFWATGACMFVRSEAFWKVGGFDNDYFAHMEEIDVCWRMKNIGYQIYVEPKSKVYHVGGGTLNKLSPRKTFLNFRNNLMTLTKNASPRFLFFKIIYRMVLDGVAACKFLVEGNGSHFIAVIKAHFSFYKHLPATLKKRDHMRLMEDFKDTTSGVYENNIVYAHFVKGIKHYSDLKQ
ncbi:MAG: glycosyltransferase family 2 protein [Bacteroidia bacterium]|nr:glycosyltransferase family 2 protein [Bacteroidia bacterium]